VLVSFLVAMETMWVGRWHDEFNFRNGHEWKEAKEK
jgi:hypothetical protein